MRELSEEELLDVLNILKGGIKWRDKEFNLQAYKQIKESILNQPEVDEVFIMDWSRFLVSLPIREHIENWTIEMPRQLKKMLQKAGVKIKE